jgi:hypothetical protein
MSHFAKSGVRRIAVVAFSLVAVAVIVAGLRAATPGASGSPGSPAAVQQTVIGTASFLAQVGRVPSLINFEDQPANAPLAPSAYAGRGEYRWMSCVTTAAKRIRFRSTLLKG